MRSTPPVRRRRWPTALVLVVLASAIVPRLVFRERGTFTHAEVERRASGTTASPRHLVVLVHGLSGRDAMNDVRDVVQQTHPAADILMPGFPPSPMGNENPLAIVRHLLAAVDRAVANERYARVTFVGYSLGALLVRKAVVCSMTGCPDDYAGSEKPRAWAAAVDRLVLLAGMNRGWATHCEKVVAMSEWPLANRRGSHELGAGEGAEAKDTDCRADKMGQWERWSAELGQRLAGPLGFGRLMLSVRRGEPFVANLRLEWLDIERRGVRLPDVVQLLGTIDDKVSRDDNVDRFVTSSFTFLKLENTDHVNAVDLRSSEQRRTQFVKALTTPSDRLKTIDELPADERLKQDTTVKHVVFVMHGIRDVDPWVQSLGQRIEAGGTGVKAFYRSYGYFPALYFLMRHRMMANVRWFVDQYTELKAQYPNAERFSFVGHSNGTYMLANAIAGYHPVRFDRIVLAGSVIPTSFDWDAYQGRFGALRNYRGANDYVVALLPSVFERFPRILNVGAAGHEGFKTELGQRYQSKYFAMGGHSAAIHSDNFDAIANFVLAKGCTNGEVVCEAIELPAARRASAHTPRAEYLYEWSLALWLVGLSIIAGIFYLLVWLRKRHRPESTVRALVPGVAFIAIVMIVLRYV